MSENNSLKDKYCFWGFLILGILIFFHEFIFSGFDRLPGALMDGRLINYILEHIYSWVLQIDTHKELFTMPFYYPLKNNLFFSDTFISVAPIYMIFRHFMNPYYSYGFFLVSICVLNYISFYLLLKKLFHISSFWYGFGAYLFAFTMANYYHLLHPQMLTQFFTIFSFLCILSVKKRSSICRKLCLFGLSGFLMACQFYSSFYLGFWVYFGCLVLFILSIPQFIFNRVFRKKIFIFLKHYFLYMLFGFIIFLLFIFPLGYFYFQTNIIRTIDEMYKPYSIYYSGSFVWSWLMKSGDNVIYYPWYKNNFGFFTVILGCIGLFKINKKYFFLILFCYYTIKNGVAFDIPKLAYVYLPGAKAIRFWYRIIYLMLPFLVIGNIYFLVHFKNKFLVFVFSVFLFLEQIPVLSIYGWTVSDEIKKMEKLEKQIPQYCNIIGITSDDYEALANLDSMWLAHYRRIYSRVGYTGVLMEYLDVPPVTILPGCYIKVPYKVSHYVNIFN